MANYHSRGNLEGVNFGDYPSSCIKYYDHHDEIVQRGVPQRGTIPKSQKKTSFGSYDHSKIVPQEGKVPESLKELLARTAKEYQWSPEKLAYIERGLRNQNWSADQIALVEKTIREEKWTTKHIVELEKSFREKKNGDFIVLAQGYIPSNNNNNMSSENYCAFSTTTCNDIHYLCSRSDGIHPLRDDESSVSVIVNNNNNNNNNNNGFSAAGIRGLMGPARRSNGIRGSTFVSVEVKVECALM